MENDRENRIRERAHSLWQSQGSPPNKELECWLQAEREINHEDSQTEPGDLPRLEAMREASRQHSDIFVVSSDMEDADEREASPGTREQP
jgi:hypothetical protein